MFDPPDACELKRRQQALLAEALELEPGLDTLLVFDRISQFYLTGTFQDALFVLRRDGQAVLFVRKSIDRALLESPLDNIRGMRSYRDLKDVLPADLGLVGIDTRQTLLSQFQSLKKHVKMAGPVAVDAALATVRSRKTPAELARMTEAGKQQHQLMHVVIPNLLQEGMSEAQLMAAVYTAMIDLGHHGVSRFSMHQVNFPVGQIAFGTQSLHPHFFDGPAGMRGLGAAVSVTGSQDRKLKVGDLIYCDLAFGVDGYHTDKTQVYCFGGPVPQPVLQAHRACRDLLRLARSLLMPGQSPSAVYRQLMANKPEGVTGHFMGYDSRPVRFLGHGVGLTVDEAPVLTDGFDQPLEAGMVLAVEPKIGLDGHGMVGVEETYVLTQQGPRCLTGGDEDIICVG